MFKPHSLQNSIKIIVAELHVLALEQAFFALMYTGYTQKNGAVSKVKNKFISHLTWAQRTPSAAATVQVSHALITTLQCVYPRSHTSTR